MHHRMFAKLYSVMFLFELFLFEVQKNIQFMCSSQALHSFYSKLTNTKAHISIL